MPSVTVLKKATVSLFSFNRDREKSITTILVDRQEQRNALSLAMWEELPSLIAEEEKQGTRVLIFSGVGKLFGAGADLGELKELKSNIEAKRLWQAISGAFKAVGETPLATIARINGPCLGGSCLLASFCDLRIASQDAVFAVPVAKLGIILDDECVLRLADLIGPARTKELLFCAATIDSAEALAIGLINRLVPESADTKKDLEAQVEKIAIDIAENSAGTIAQAKASLLKRLHHDYQSSTEKLAAVEASYLTDEFRQRLEKLGII